MLDTVQQAESAVESLHKGAGCPDGPGTSRGQSKHPVPQGPRGGRGAGAITVICGTEHVYVVE